MAVPNLWRTNKQRYRLQSEICPACQTALFPPRQVCPHCNHGAATAAPVAFAEDCAEAHSYMMIFTLPQAAELTIGDD